ncbi:MULTISPECIES: hypothetical protein [Streptomyces]|uniref:Secreted protein n=1 Tax=Streptomyces ramulosus TaxID=47762 RepID=A0ABW1FRF4_9ACTN
MIKRTLLALTSALLTVTAVAPVASADSPSPKEGKIYITTYAGDPNVQLDQCNRDGQYLAYVAHYQGAYGYTCEPKYSAPPNTPQCPIPNPDGCIGTWYRLFLITT